MTTVDDITAAIVRMRRAHSETLSHLTQAQVVQVIGEWARRWQDPDWAYLQEAQSLFVPFPFSHVRVSLDGLLPSLAPEQLYSLITAEGVREARGVSVAGHVIAGNTPLLAWVSLLRALLMRTASAVKLPSGAAGAWGHLFFRSLADVSPVLASCIELLDWPGGTPALDAALCGNVDLVIANGGNETIRALRVLTPATTLFLGYGHAVSFGLTLAGVDLQTAAQGFARDVLLYGGDGCLSVKVIFVQGSLARAAEFAECLSVAMTDFGRYNGASQPTPADRQARRDTKLLAALRPGAMCFAAGENECAVVLWPEPVFKLLPGAACVVQAWRPGAPFVSRFAPVAGHLQGCAVAGDMDKRWQGKIDALGVSRVCAAGDIQAPPLGWRQDGRDVLQTFLPAPVILSATTTDTE